ncbi:MAG: RagB/SusD family nutrient uptake outer membrane protein, partial [Bacteroidetes bacterium]|nr:RagB/SusD family nutrient uptake outer membrane protein [Bacteroidota bacterium]
MKKYSYIFLSSLLAMGACKKSNLDLFPYNAKETSQAFLTQADVTLAVNGMYYGIKSSGSYYNGTWNIFADAMADNLILSKSGRGSFTNYSEWLFNPNSTYGLFSGGYTMTRRANAILENIDNFPAGSFRDNAKGEALAIRGMTYFDMSRVYSKTYLNATATDSTLPYVTSTDATIKPSKESLKGFYDKVIADLTQAYSLINTDNGTGRLNKASVAGILSRVLLYKGDWTGTIAAANNAIGTGIPNVTSMADFSKVWTDQSTSGVLFKVINNSVDNINTQGVNYYQKVTVSGIQYIKSEYVVEYNFYKMFQDNDIRKTSWIVTSPYLGNNFNNVIKYNGATGSPAGVQDAKVLRSAEVLLNRMEAYYMNNNPTAALTDLNTLRANRYNPNVPLVGLTGQPLLDSIYKERRLELAFEGDRWFDLKRRNLPVVRDGTKGDLADGTGTPYPSIYLNLPVGDKRWL